jgi:hypothetical protein
VTFVGREIASLWGFLPKPQEFAMAGRRFVGTTLGALLCGGAAIAQGASFASPVLIEAGAPTVAGPTVLGKGRLYPSPVLHDLDGDGRLDVVVGDLRGHLTTAVRLPGDGAPKFAAEQKLLAKDGKDLDFGNW